jgi:uncharacterized protein
MSQQHVDALRRGFEAFQQGDWEAVLEDVHPDVEVHEPRELPDAQVLHGHAGLRAALERGQEMFDDLRIYAEEFIDAGDQVVIWYRVIGRGKGSGAEVEMDQAGVWTFRGGTVVRVDGYFDRAQALEFAGVRA